MKANQLYSLLLLAITAALFNSCYYCTEGNGNILTEERLVTEFSGVENSTSFNIDIIYDSAYSVDVTADENILPLINTSVRGDMLIIETNYNMCITSGSTVSIEIRLPYINNIALDGSGNMDVYDFDTDYLEIENSGSGNIDISSIYATNTIDIRIDGSGDVSIAGKARRGDYTVSGSGSIYAENLLVDDCYAVNSGSGDIHCFVYDFLDAIVDGSGDIIYSGSPDEVREEVNGSGRIRRVN